jgi:hypothetical protein
MHKSGVIGKWGVLMERSNKEEIKYKVGGGNRDNKKLGMRGGADKNRSFGGRCIGNNGVPKTKGKGRED